MILAVGSEWILGWAVPPEVYTVVFGLLFILLGVVGVRVLISPSGVGVRHVL